MGSGEWGVGNEEWEPIRIDDTHSPLPTPHSLLTKIGSASRLYNRRPYSP